jgi:hypothetical protein
VEYFDQDATETATVSDLGAFVREQNRSAGEETATAIHLHHSTLPKLADAGIIDYDPRGEVPRGQAPWHSSRTAYKIVRYRGLSSEETD